MGGSRAWETDDLENLTFDRGHFRAGMGGKLESRPVRGVHTGLAGTQHPTDHPLQVHGPQPGLVLAGILVFRGVQPPGPGYLRVSLRQVRLYFFRAGRLVVLSLTILAPSSQRV